LFQKNGTHDSVVLVHYVGCSVPQINKPHGNAKHLPTPHVMTTKSQLDKQKANLNEKPKHLYRKLTCAGSENPMLIPVTEPKNSKQVSNTLIERSKKDFPHKMIY